MKNQNHVCPVIVNVDRFFVEGNLIEMSYRGQGEPLTVCERVDRGYIVEMRGREEFTFEDVQEIAARMKKAAEQGVFPYAHCDNAHPRMGNGQVIEALFLSPEVDGTEGHPGNIWGLPEVLFIPMWSIEYAGETAED